MDFSRLKHNVTGAQNQNKWLRNLLLAMIVANIFLAITAFHTRAIVTIQPPSLHKEVKITRDSANAPYYRAWGMFVAELVGNVKPGRTDFILDTLGPLLATDIYRPITTSIQKQATTIDRDHITSSFMAQKVLYDAKHSTVYVTGKETSAGPGSDPVTQIRTYEMTMKIRGYRPVITALKVYKGHAQLPEDDK